MLLGETMVLLEFMSLCTTQLQSIILDFYVWFYDLSIFSHFLWKYLLQYHVLFLIYHLPKLKKAENSVAWIF